MNAKDQSASRAKYATKSDNTLTLGLIGLLVLFVALLGLSVFFIQQNNQKDQSNIQLTAEMRANLFNGIAESRDAVAGNEQSFAKLQKLVKQMDDTSKQITTGDLVTQLPREVQAYSNTWDRVKKNATSIVSSQEKIIFLHDVAKRLNQTIPQLQKEHDDVVDILLENHAPADQVAQARSQSWKAERIARNVDKMLAGGADAKEAADQFNYDASLFGTVLKGMLEGNVAMRISKVTDPDAKSSLDQVKQLFKFVSESVDDIYQSAPVLFESTKAVNALLNDQPAMVEALDNLAGKIGELKG